MLARRALQFQTEPDDLHLLEGDERSLDVDVAFFGSGLDEAIEGGVVLGTAVGIAGAVLGDGADEDVVGAEDLGPTDGDGEEMGVAEGNVGDGDVRAPISGPASGTARAASVRAEPPIWLSAWLRTMRRRWMPRRSQISVKARCSRASVRWP